jgi:uncharacterized protein YciI
MTHSGKPHTRYVIIHFPGPKWVPGLDFREQEGIELHVRHYSAVHEAGHLQLGGPFLLPDAGGMMLPDPSLVEEEVRGIAESDPAVKNGLLKVEIRPWSIAMSKES